MACFVERQATVNFMKIFGVCLRVQLVCPLRGGTWKRWTGGKGGAGEEEGGKGNQAHTGKVMLFSSCDPPWQFSLLIPALEWD